ncbi:MAG: hypothetical protein AAB527_02985 [Patescibacteria group bacterium]
MDSPEGGLPEDGRDPCQADARRIAGADDLAPLLADLATRPAVWPAGLLDLLEPVRIVHCGTGKTTPINIFEKIFFIIILVNII